MNNKQFVFTLTVNRKLFLFIFFVILFFFPKPSFSRDEAITFEMAREIYLDRCSVCHGEKGDGKTHAIYALSPKPRDFVRGDTGRLTEESMIWAVTEGVSKSAMVAWKYDLTPLQIKSVVGYIRTYFMKVSPYPEEGFKTTNADLLDVGMNLFNSSKNGKKIYDLNCLPCHGEHGDGKGSRSSLIFPPPTGFLENDISEIKKVIRFGKNGKQMPGWNGILSDTEVDTVAYYVLKEFVTQP